MVFLPGGIAAVMYWLVAVWLKVPAAREMTDFVLSKFRKVTRGSGR
jgi:hypothetical protein